jgi:hypothetical protein
MRLPLLMASLLAVAPSSPPAQGSAPSCDTLLEQPSSNPYGYRLRGDRCEGVYVQSVAGTPLVVAGFTATFDQYDVRTVQSLDIQWSTPTEGEIQLRAYGLRRKLYYRMDALLPSSRRSYTWPAEILSALEIPKSDVGVAGWIGTRVGHTNRDVYLPLRIGADRSRSATYTLVLLPSVPLSEVYVSVAPVDGNGVTEKYIRDEEPLKYNYYPAERAIEVPISALPAPGIYYVLIGAELKDGGSLTSELWFYHPPQ